MKKLTKGMSDWHDTINENFNETIVSGKNKNMKILLGGGQYELKKGDNSFEVKFEESFSTLPKVFTNMHTSNPADRNSSAMSATTSGFTLNISSTTEATKGNELYVSWLAIGGK